ncbi:zinc-ribbon domain-containing protein [Paenisporosarcina indica]
MNACPNCHHQVKQRSGFCPNCGSNYHIQKKNLKA